MAKAPTRDSIWRPTVVPRPGGDLWPAAVTWAAEHATLTTELVEYNPYLAVPAGPVKHYRCTLTSRGTGKKMQVLISQDPRPTAADVVDALVDDARLSAKPPTEIAGILGLRLTNPTELKILQGTIATMARNAARFNQLDTKETDGHVLVQPKPVGRVDASPRAAAPLPPGVRRDRKRG